MKLSKLSKLSRLSTALGFSMLGACLLFSAGCNKQADNTMNYKAAINDYYKAHPACLWSEPKKFPVQAATSDDAKTQGYDALTDASLLTRTTGEKKVLIIASKQVNNYDVSDKGPQRVDAGSDAAWLWELLLWTSRCDLDRQCHDGRR